MTIEIESIQSDFRAAVKAERDRLNALLALLDRKVDSEGNSCGISEYILEILREADRPLTSGEIAQILVNERGFVASGKTGPSGLVSSAATRLARLGRIQSGEGGYRL